MLTQKQRKFILVWGSYTLFVASLFPIVLHGIILPVLPFYLSAGIIISLTYVGLKYTTKIWYA